VEVELAILFSFKTFAFIFVVFLIFFSCLTFCHVQIRAPSDLITLMSSLREGSEPDTEDDSKCLHRFKQPIPIPSYLIAIVVGDLVSKLVPIGCFKKKNKRVYANYIYI